MYSAIHEAVSPTPLVSHPLSCSWLLPLAISLDMTMVAINYFVSVSKCCVIAPFTAIIVLYFCILYIVCGVLKGGV